jgi:hypothetical protein
VHLASFSKEVKDGEIDAKMLQSLPPHFKQTTIAIKTLLIVSIISVTDLTGQLKQVEEAFKEAPTSLQQDRKLYLIEEEWDVWRNKRKAENYSDGGVGKGGGCDRLHRAGHRTSPPMMSAGAATRLGIGHMSAARSPRRSRCTSWKMRRRGCCFS